MIKLLPVVGNDSRDFFCLFPDLLPGRTRAFCLRPGCAPSSPGIEPIMPEDGVHPGRRSSRSPAGMKKTLTEMSGEGLAVCCFALPMHDGTDAFREGNFIGQNLYRAIKRQRTGISCFPVRPI